VWILLPVTLLQVNNIDSLRKAGFDWSWEYLAPRFEGRDRAYCQLRTNYSGSDDPVSENAGGGALRVEVSDSPMFLYWSEVRHTFYICMFFVFVNIFYSNRKRSRHGIRARNIQPSKPLMTKLTIKLLTDRQPLYIL
jgi:hypothetical protein